jgi:hypothetical protein
MDSIKSLIKEPDKVKTFSDSGSLRQARRQACVSFSVIHPQ